MSRKYPKKLTTVEFKEDSEKIGEKMRKMRKNVNGYQDMNKRVKEDRRQQQRQPGKVYHEINDFPQNPEDTSELQNFHQLDKSQKNQNQISQSYTQIPSWNSPKIQTNSKSEFETFIGSLNPDQLRNMQNMIGVKLEIQDNIPKDFQDKSLNNDFPLDVQQPINESGNSDIILATISNLSTFFSEKLEFITKHLEDHEIGENVHILHEDLNEIRENLNIIVEEMKNLNSEQTSMRLFLTDLTKYVRDNFISFQTYYSENEKMRNNSKSLPESLPLDKSINEIFSTNK